MSCSTPSPHANHPVHEESYAHGYDSALTLKMHTSRTADKQASWFLPYLRPRMSLLDCGCASGSITVGLANIVYPGEVTGIDISEMEIDRARERAASAAVPNIRFVVGDVYQLDFPDNSFDSLFSHNVLEHIDDPGRALREMYRVLKPDGIIGVRDTDMGGTLHAPNDDRLSQFWTLYEADWEAVNGHPRLGRHLARLLIETGYIDVEASASYEVYCEPERRRFIGHIAISRITEPDFVGRVTVRGLANSSQLEAMREAWVAWQQLPGAFVALAHGEAVGRKA